MANIKYTSTAVPKLEIRMSANNILTNVESHLRYSAKPPQTPASILSVLDFLNLAGMIVLFDSSLP